MHISGLLAFLGKEGIECYQEGREQIKEVIISYLAQPDFEFSWDTVLSAAKPYKADNRILRTNYSQLFNRLCRSLVEQQRLVAFLRGNKKYYTVLPVEDEPEVAGGELADYESLFPKIKERMWAYLGRLKTGDQVLLDDMMDAVRLPDGVDKQVIKKCRNYLYGRMLDLSRSGAFWVMADPEPYTRRSRYTRTAEKMTPPASFARYFRS